MLSKSMPLRRLIAGAFPRPYVDVRYINPHTGDSLDNIALIDTGADRCVVPSWFAEPLCHNLNKGRQTSVRGVDGISDCYLHTMQIEIPGFLTQEIEILFSDGIEIPLLGACTFLSNFKLTVNYPSRNFSLDLPSPEEDIAAWPTP